MSLLQTANEAFPFTSVDEPSTLPSLHLVINTEAPATGVLVQSVITKLVLQSSFKFLPFKAPASKQHKINRYFICLKLKVCPWIGFKLQFNDFGLFDTFNHIAHYNAAFLVGCFFEEVIIFVRFV